MNASLVVVGSGIKFLSHLTTEARAYIEQSDKVLYLVNEPILKLWIQQANKNTESLDDIYLAYKSRHESYEEITNYILKALRQNIHVCVVLYGHPSVFSRPALDAVIQAKKEGYYASILPGISSEDCMFADLQIDPASHGCLSLEATDLLVHQRYIDPSCHVILWQVSVIGLLGHENNYDNNKGLELLYEYLCRFYSLDHELVSYSAAQYPGFDPIIKRFRLRDLREVVFPRVSTLYVPPSKPLISDKSVLSSLMMI